MDLVSTLRDSRPGVQNVSNNVPVILNIPSEAKEQISNPLKQTKIRQDGHFEKGGKRWVRRRDNSRFVANPHIVKPTTKDFNVHIPPPRTTFPKPLPPYLPRHLSAPSASAPRRDPTSANAGRYSLSLKGVRRELRRSGPGSEQIVLDIEQELTQWLHSGGILLSPDSHQMLPPNGVPGKPLGSTNSILELGRSPTELIWRIDEDFPRFLLHCVARFHGVVSFSKTAPEGDIRLTHLLRPNVTRPDFAAPRALDTPPASDFSDAFSVVADSEDSDAASEQGYRLDQEEGDLGRQSRLSVLPEEQESPVHHLRRHEDDFHGETDSSVGEEHEDDEGLSWSIDSLALAPSNRDWEQTPRQATRSASSPSRSPSRPFRRSSRRAVRPTLVAESNKLSFWHYVFA